MRSGGSLDSTTQNFYYHKQSRCTCLLTLVKCSRGGWSPVKDRGTPGSAKCTSPSSPRPARDQEEANHSKTTQDNMHRESEETVSRDTTSQHIPFASPRHVYS